MSEGTRDDQKLKIELKDIPKKMSLHLQREVLREHMDQLLSESVDSDCISPWMFLYLHTDDVGLVKWVLRPGEA